MEERRGAHRQIEFIAALDVEYAPQPATPFLGGQSRYTRSIIISQLQMEKRTDSAAPEETRTMVPRDFLSSGRAT